MFYTDMQACPTPLDVVHSSYWNKGTNVGVKVIYECNIGFSVVTGDLEQICTNAGHWTGTLPVCQGNSIVAAQITL